MTIFNKRFDKSAEQRERDQMLCKGLAAQASRIGGGRFPNAPSEADALRQHEVAKYGIVGREREPHSIGDPDPDRRRELGEIEITLDSGPRRIRVRHDPQERTLNLHGAHVRLDDLEPGLARSFEATAALFNQMQGELEQEDQRILLGALIDRAMRRNKWLSDAVVRQLDNERYGV
jgi:hypothetical protein